MFNLLYRGKMMEFNELWQKKKKTLQKIIWDDR